jgi:hypothetical protein
MTFELGQIVTANSGAALGLPYRAKIEMIEGDRARVRPLHPTLTEGSARGSRTRKGPSVRARWVNMAGLRPIEE